MSPAFLRLALRVRNKNFRVYLPLFFGHPGQDSLLRGGLALTFCLRREFYLFARDRSSPIAQWLQALCRQIHAECPGPGVGAIGMCLTGGIILSVMLDESVLAPVICEPALPFALPLSSRKRKAALGISPADLEKVKKRAEEAPILAYRFTTDWICPAGRFDALRSNLGEKVKATEIPTGPNQPGNIRRGAHAVLTEEYCDDGDHPTRHALDEILARFKQRLGRPRGAA
jgi:dienelactone hydrolase